MTAADQLRLQLRRRATTGAGTLDPPAPAMTTAQVVPTQEHPKPPAPLPPKPPVLRGPGVSPGQSGTGAVLPSAPFLPPQDAHPLPPGAGRIAPMAGGSPDPSGAPPLVAPTLGPSDPPPSPDPPPGDVPPPRTPPPIPPPIPDDPRLVRRSQIHTAYAKYLRRGATDAEVDAWMGNDNFEEEIKNSPEARRAAGGGSKTPTRSRSWFSATFGEPTTVAALLALEPSLAEYGIKVIRNSAGVAGKIQYPDGRIVDVILAAGEGGRGFQWLEDGGDGGGSGDPGAPGESEQQRALRQILMDRIKGLQGPFDPNADPGITVPFEAARATAQRQLDSERQALAERLFAEGGGDVQGGELTQGIQQSQERTALGLGSLRGELVVREIATRRAELQDTLQLAIASGDAAAARDIQWRMAQLDAILRREGYGIDMAKYLAGINQQ